MRLVFMGTPEFAIPSLNQLKNSGHEIACVYTRKSSKRGRGQKLHYTPIYNLAVASNLKIFTPSTFKNGKNLDELKTLKPDLIVVVAYGLILPKELLEIPRYGCLNVHPSLLPRWRGCAPMERCLMSDDMETGVCIMKVNEDLDSGEIISTHRIKIDQSTDIRFLRRNLSIVGAEMLVKTIDALEKTGQIYSIGQDDRLATFAPKIGPSDSIVNWHNDSVIKIHRKIMAINDSFGVNILHRNNKLKLMVSNYILKENSSENIGKIVDNRFFLGCRDGVLKILEIQREGKKPLPIKSFINGYRFNVGDTILPANPSST
jgi:methionyl-tRNA formyltransferase